jgi:Fe-S oxidoreductase
MTKIKENCIECGLCADSCAFLTEIGQSPLTMAKRGITVSEAFSCSLCGVCEAVCPQGYSPRKVFADRRNEALKDGEFDIDEYRYMFPDRRNNMMNVFRKYCGIDYSDIDSFSEVETCFFPGCTLMTYSPGLTRSIFDHLKKSCGCLGMWTECCGKPLDQMGLQQRFKDTQERLRKFVQDHNVKRIIVACPGCYYDLLEVFQSCNVVIQTVYEVLNFINKEPNEGKQYTIHDACPDRFTGKFGEEVRQALKQCNFSIVEMKHTRANTICCGSGGQISHFRPDLTEQLVKLRQDEAKQAGADILVGYCLSCVLKYNKKNTDVPVTHALNLLLGVKEDFKGAKERANEMVSGPDGEKKWLEIMAD